MGVGIERANFNTKFEAIAPVDSNTLVKWPIKQITMLDGSPLQYYVPLHGIHASYGQESNEVSDENVDNHANIALSTKIRYTFINRPPKPRA